MAGGAQVEQVAEGIRTRFASLTAQQQACVLAQLARWYTLVASDAEAGRKASGGLAHALVALNELEHVTVGQLGRLLAGDARRYPDEVFLSILQERTRKAGLAVAFEQQLREALDFASGERGGSSDSPA